MQPNITAVQRLAITPFTLFIITLPARAQVGTGTIAGVATAPLGAALPGATVLIRNTQTGVVTQAATNTEVLNVALGLAVGSNVLKRQSQPLAS